jgi:DNA-binding PadR family transcriptional regulator
MSTGPLAVRLEGAHSIMAENSTRNGAVARVQDFILLGLLHEGPKHGYELKNIIDERLRYLTEITSGTVYYTLKKLERSGLVNRRTEREGERPERHVYAITEAGEKEFRELARTCLYTEEKLYSTFNVAFYFTHYLDRGEVLEAIEFQLEALSRQEAIAKDLEENYPGAWPLNFALLRSRRLAEIALLKEWHEKLKSELKRRTRS